MALPRKTPNRIYMTLTDSEKLILDTMGNGSDHAGMKRATRPSPQGKMCKDLV